MTDENIINEANRWHEFKKHLQNSGLGLVLPYDKDGNYDLKRMVELIAYAINHIKKMPSHTKECIELNDISTKEVCICEDNKNA